MRRRTRDQDAKPSREERLHLDKLWAQKAKHIHRKGVHGSCAERCEDDFPCKAYRAAEAEAARVDRELKEFGGDKEDEPKDIADRLQQARLDWRQ